MNEAVPAPERYQMSARSRRRFLIAFFMTLALLFVAGMAAYVLSFRHHTICPGGADYISRTDDGLGQVTYLCPGGKVVEVGLIP